MDLILEVPLLFTEAAFGSSNKNSNINKSVTLKIPSGTASGKTFKIRGEGITPQGRRSGDLYVKYLQLLLQQTYQDLQKNI